MSKPGSPRTDAMVRGRQADTERRRTRVEQSLRDLQAGGQEVPVTAVARRAGVDRTFLYRHRDLLTQIHTAEHSPAKDAGKGAGVSRASLMADLAAANERNARLMGRIRMLEQRLSQVMGEQTWKEFGLGAPEGVDRLQQRIVQLEQERGDLRLKLDEAVEDLEAARSTNRELTRALNQAG
ncbi:DUF6262 family protein [Streptomyces tanashiensis]|uniref:DUF6262 family protein n=1 Tax=Streptomyces tanashiensis TaxID=67367 RepID=UPI00199FF9E6|nr:DUF6262 family protein [Streptomyces tanashiensis]GGY18168.1 hypothetical protein GCM10010299_24600 [Streptomyces tanashiensis]